MSKFLILLIAAFPLFLAAKETKKIVRVPYPAFSETFYVLKSDTGIRHGSYQAKVDTVMTILDRPPPLPWRNKPVQ